MARRASFTVEQEGLTETIRAFNKLERELERPAANRELRGAAGDCSRVLVGELVAAAERSGVPVARRVAASIRVKSDRIPSVQIGGTKKVGRTGAIAAKLMWGSEHGPAAEADRNRFGVGRGPGYWIAPTVERFQGSKALDAYNRALYQIMRRYKLI